MQRGQTDFFIKKWKSHIASSSDIQFSSHANLKLHRNRNPLTETGLERSNLCGFVCVVMRFDILLMSFKTIFSYLTTSSLVETPCRGLSLGNDYSLRE